MSGRRTRSESLWDRKEEGGPETDIGGKIPWQGKEFDSSFHGDGSPKPSNSEANDALMPGDFSHGNEFNPTDNDNRHRLKMDPAFDDWENQYASRPSDDLPYRSGERGNMSKDRERSRSRSWSPHRTRGRDRDRGRARSRSRSRDRGGSRFHDEKVSTRGKGSDGYRKDGGRNEEGRDDNICKDYIKGRCRRGASCGFSHHLPQDHRRQSTRDPCKFFLMGNCNRSNCKFSHDAPKSHDSVHGHALGDKDFSDFPKPNRDFDDKNKFWNNSSLEPRAFDESEKNSCILSRVANEAGNQESSQSHTLDARLQHAMADTTTMIPEVPGFQKPGEADTHNIVSNQQVHSYGSEFVHNTASQFPSTLNGNENNSSNGNGSGQGMFSQNQQNKPVEKDGLPQNINLANALELLYSLPNNIASSGAIYESTVVGQESNSKEMVASESVKVSEAIGKAEVNEKKVGEKAKVEEGTDEKAMRQFKIALVEFVKEILKPTWKEGKMSREVYKTIVKKVVDKVTSTIQGNQIPRTQEKIDQYLAFSKSKITKLVEAYVGRFLKA